MITKEIYLPYFAIFNDFAPIAHRAIGIIRINCMAPFQGLIYCGVNRYTRHYPILSYVWALSLGANNLSGCNDKLCFS